MTDRQFKTITKKLHFYNQGGIKNLCTMTETMLRQVMEEAAGVTQAYIRKLVQHDVDQQNKIALLSAKVYKLGKENAELKKEWQEQVQKAADEGYARTLQTIQLSKAKEIIKKLMVFTEMDDREYEKEYKEAEQFLSEVEK